MCANFQQDSGVADLSDDELSDYEFDVVVQHMANQPERAVEIFETLGWELRPSADHEMAVP